MLTTTKGCTFAKKSGTGRWNFVGIFTIAFLVNVLSNIVQLSMLVLSWDKKHLAEPTKPKDSISADDVSPVNTDGVWNSHYNHKQECSSLCSIVMV
jgi:hypothetical protein